MDQSVIGSGAAGGAAGNAQLVARIDQLERQLLQSEKLAAIGQLATGVAHEINNPVGFVSSNLSSLATYVERLFGLLDAYERALATLPADHPLHAELAAQRAAADVDFLRQDVPDLLHESDEGLNRVKHITNGLKDFARVDDGQREAADLHHGLESTLTVIWNEIKYKAQIVREFGELPLVECVPAQINQVFMNLLANAAQAIESTGTITLRTGVAGAQVWIEIQDSGKGIPPEIQARIFEPFYTTKPVGKGTGLGLSISRDIIARHGGRLSVTSAPGQGACFRIELPLIEEARGG